MTDVHAVVRRLACGTLSLERALAEMIDRLSTRTGLPFRQRTELVELLRQSVSTDPQLQKLMAAVREQLERIRGS